MIVLLGLLLASCSAGALLTLKMGEKTFNLELATTPAQRQRGLMFRDSLPQDGGTIFVFDEPEVLSFWMRNTRIPLDIAYIDSEGRILDILPLEPFNETPVPSSGLALYAIEVNRGAIPDLQRGQVINLTSLRSYLKTHQKVQN